MFKSMTLALVTIVSMSAAHGRGATLVEMGKQIALLPEDIENLHCFDIRHNANTNYSLSAKRDANGQLVIETRVSYRYATVMPAFTTYAIESLEWANNDAVEVKGVSENHPAGTEFMTLRMASLEGGAALLMLAPLLHSESVQSVPMDCVNKNLGSEFPSPAPVPSVPSPMCTMAVGVLYHPVTGLAETYKNGCVRAALLAQGYSESPITVTFP